MCLRATTASACIFKPTLERDGFRLNHDRALDLWWSMIFFGKPVSTFPDHALAATNRRRLWGGLIVCSDHGARERPQLIEDDRVKNLLHAPERTRHGRAVHHAVVV